MKKLLFILATITLTATPLIGLGFQQNANADNLQKSDSNSQKATKQNQQLGGKKLNPKHYFTKNESLSMNDISKCYGYNNVVYVETDSGLYESTDNGITFKQNKSIPTHTYIESIYAYNKVVYIGTFINGLYESTDNGKTFKQNTSIPKNAEIEDIQAFNNIIYVGTSENGLWESTDKGKTFAQNISVPFNDYIESIYAYSNVIYAVENNGGLLESIDNGQTFKPYASFFDNWINIDSIYAYLGVVYVIADDVGSGDTYIYESIDNGRNFIQNKSIKYIELDPPKFIYGYNNTVFCATLSGGVYESTDNGKTFKQNKSIPTHTDIESIYAYKGIVYLGIQTYETEKDLIYESNDNGKTFTQNTSIPTHDVFGKYPWIYAYKNVVYVGTGQGLYEYNPYLKDINNFWNYKQQSDTSWDNNDGITLFYNQIQNIVFKNNPEVADNHSYVVNGKTYTFGAHVSLNNNKFQPNTIEIKLKNHADASKYPLGNSKTGVVKFYIQIQDGLYKQPTYKALNNGTQLYQGPNVSKGNIKNWNIFRTDSHNSNAPIEFNDSEINYINLNNSYYTKGTVNNKNNFNATSNKMNISSSFNDIDINGIYHLHIEDIFGNTYNSLLELGKSNWKAKNSFQPTSKTKTILAAVFGSLGGIAVIAGFVLLYRNRWSPKARQKGLPEPDNKPSNWKKMSREAKIAHLKSEGWGHFEESEQEK